MDLLKLPKNVSAIPHETRHRIIGVTYGLIELSEQLPFSSIFQTHFSKET